MARAEADCASPSATVAPRDGAAVPANPVLHAFVPTWRVSDTSEFRVVADGVDVFFAATVASRSAAFTSFRIVVETGDAKAFDVRFEDQVLGTYTVDPGWRAAAAAIEVQSSEYIHDVWTCSHTDAHFLTVTEAPAYHVQWATTAAAFERGAVETVVFPRHVDDFWRWGDRAATAGAGRVGLGHLNCFGDSATSGPSIEARYVCVRALYADGSMSAPCEQPGRVDADGYAAPAAPIVAAPIVAAESQPEPAPHMVCDLPAPRSRDGFSAHYLWALLAVLGGFVLSRQVLRRLSPARRAHVSELSRRFVPHVLGAILFIGAVAWALHAAWRAARWPQTAAGFAVASATWAFVAGAALGMVRRRSRV